MTSCKIYGIQIYGIRDGSGPPAAAGAGKITNVPFRKYDRDTS
jgi:hypothetical protein